jgi:glycopeptide antibiotics resistance protein
VWYPHLLPLYKTKLVPSPFLSVRRVNCFIVYNSVGTCTVDLAFLYSLGIGEIPDNHHHVFAIAVVDGFVHTLRDRVASPYGWL